MMIQPGIALVFSSDCGSECASGLMCEGCGCCEVSSPTEKCGCCGGGDQDGDGSCCIATSQRPNQEWTEKEMMSGEPEAGETLELQVIVISTANAGETDDQQAREVTSTCHCGMESQPIGDSSPTRPTIERRDSVAIRFADLSTIFGDAVLIPPRLFRGDALNSPERFSQFHLCNWRL
ncbi:hypothetical protein Enr13x_74080 [Stieleria neptunia]|uniref:Uncharacterized protein n=1 Tax=Stieleria neptunia TaxID=2527979 RepID=A0A518I330_9BACT|nr:hypothetical protein Enr13x_74080 [Stieleria neptunia]